MDIKNIAAFVRIVEFNNFTKAAASLGYSQAAVTAQIKALEKELGVPLFDRIGKRIYLTQAGKTFLPYALKLLRAEEEALQSVHPRPELTGELRICSASSYAGEVLPGILMEYHRQHPGVNLIVKISDFLEDTTQKLARGEIDFLLCLDEEHAYPEFVTVAKREEPLVFVTYPSNPALQRKKLRIRDLVTENFILSDREMGYCALLGKELRSRGIEIRPVMELGSVNTILRILLSGYGTTFIPEFMASRYLTSGELARLEVTDIHIPLHSYFVCSPDRWINPAMQEFIRIVGDFNAQETRESSLSLFGIT